VVPKPTKVAAPINAPLLLSAAELSLQLLLHSQTELMVF